MIKNSTKWVYLLLLYLIPNQEIRATINPPNPDSPPEFDNNLPVDTHLWVLVVVGVLYVGIKFRKMGMLKKLNKSPPLNQ